jgi:hypothetical protein
MASVVWKRFLRGGKRDYVVVTDRLRWFVTNSLKMFLRPVRHGEAFRQYASPITAIQFVVCVCDPP